MEVYNVVGSSTTDASLQHINTDAISSLQSDRATFLEKFLKVVSASAISNISAMILFLKGVHEG